MQNTARLVPALLLLTAACSGAPESSPPAPLEVSDRAPGTKAPPSKETLPESTETAKPDASSSSIDGTWRICPPRADPDRAYYIPYGGYRVEMKLTGDVLEARLSGQTNSWKNDLFLKGPYDATTRVWRPGFYWQHWNAGDPMDDAHLKSWFEDAATLSFNAAGDHIVGPFMANATYGGTVVGGRENGDFSCPAEDKK